MFEATALEVPRAYPFITKSSQPFGSFPLSDTLACLFVLCCAVEVVELQSGGFIKVLGPYALFNAEGAEARENYGR